MDLDGLRLGLAGLDPGGVRLRSAGAAAAGIVLAVTVVAVGRSVLVPDQPVGLAVVGGLLAMFGEVAVTDPDAARRRRTTGLGVVAAGAGLAVGAFVGPHRVAADVTFVAVVVGVVWARRYGPRADALGSLGFVGLLSAQLLRLPLASVGWALAAAAIGLGATVLVRDVLVAERPERTVDRLLGALRARARVVVLVAEGVVAGEAPALRRLRRAHERERVVSRSTLDVLDRAGAGRGATAERVIDLDLAVGELALAARVLVRPPGSGGGRARVTSRSVAEAAGAVDRALAALASAGVDSVAAPARAGEAASTTRTPPAHHRAASAAVTAIGRPARHPGAGDGAPAGGAARAADAGPGPAARGLDASTRQAAQAGVAVVLAMGVAELVAPERWYWAVLTAFVVFQGTRTRAELLERGGLRVLGTLGGCLAGVALAVLVDGDPVASGVLLVACVFLGLYLAPVSPAVLAFWITGVLALLYGLLGRFSAALLGLRLEETLIGASASVLAAALVLPTSGRRRFDAAVDGFLREADGTLAALSDPTRTFDAHALHASLDELETSGRALGGAVAGRDHPLGTALRALVACEHDLQQLGSRARQLADAGLEPALSVARDRLSRLGPLLTSGQAGPDDEQAAQPGALLDDAAARARGPAAPDAVRRLHRLAAIAQELLEVTPRRRAGRRRVGARSPGRASRPRRPAAASPLPSSPGSRRGRAR